MAPPIFEARMSKHNAEDTIILCQSLVKGRSLILSRANYNASWEVLTGSEHSECKLWKQKHVYFYLHNTVIFNERSHIQVVIYCYIIPIG